MTGIQTQNLKRWFYLLSLEPKVSRLNTQPDPKTVDLNDRHNLTRPKIISYLLVIMVVVLKTNCKKLVKWTQRHYLERPKAWEIKPPKKFRNMDLFGRKIHCLSQNERSCSPSSLGKWNFLCQIISQTTFFFTS